MKQMSIKGCLIFGVLIIIIGMGIGQIIHEIKQITLPLQTELINQSSNLNPIG
jgi:hypothetical protein